MCHLFRFVVCFSFLHGCLKEYSSSEAFFLQKILRLKMLDSLIRSFILRLPTIFKKVFIFINTNTISATILQYVGNYQQQLFFPREHASNSSIKSSGRLQSFKCFIAPNVSQFQSLLHRCL